MIEIKNLSKSFDNYQVLKDLNISIEEGRIFGLVGINGAGKSTLLRLISGIYNKDSGSILIDGEEVFENEIVKKKIFFLPDEPFYSSHVTPYNLCDLYQAFYDFDKEEYIGYLNDYKLPIKKPMSKFSKGMKRQVFISLALTIKPKYLLLDEAFDGLDPLARLKFKKAILKLVEKNKTTVIISSHSLRELEDISDCYGLLDKGMITSTGNIDNRIESYHKYQMAFEKEIKEEDFEIAFIKYEQIGRIVKVVVKEELNEFSELVKKYNPLIIDEISIDFEDLFILEVENRGYLND
ncbi:MAG: ABC transporter ATP-binding protein [Bacilli bacterium]|nr:ABC transporter ATP-binding protein [Bacilli bacterium]